MNDYRPFEWNDAIKEWKRANDWYQQLGLEPDDIIVKCLEAGVDVTDAIDILHIWGKDMLEVAKKSREPQLDEVPGNDVYDEHINPNETFKNVYNYDQTVEKPAFEETLTKCELGNVDDKENALCRNLLCRPDTATSRNKVNKIEDFADVIADNPDKFEKYKRCHDKGITYCQDRTSTTSTIPEPMVISVASSPMASSTLDIDQYDPNMFTRFQTAGDGNCLFWSVDRYINIATNLGLYPQPGLNDDILNKTVECPIATIDSVRNLRANTVKWLLDNKDEEYDLLGRTVGEEIANDSTAHLADVRNLNLDQVYVERLSLQTVNHIEHIIDGTKNAKCPQCANVVEDYADFVTARQKLIDALVIHYVDMMSKNGTYGGQHEIYALSKILQSNIIVMQSANDTFLTSNMGFVGGYDRTIYVIHTLKIGSKIGGLHYETLFALPYNKFKCNLPDYEINDLIMELQQYDKVIPLYNVANRYVYQTLLTDYIASSKKTPAMEQIVRKYARAKQPIIRIFAVNWLSAYENQPITINAALKTLIRAYNESVPAENQTEIYDDPLDNLAVMVQIAPYLDAISSPDSLVTARETGKQYLTIVFMDADNIAVLKDTYGVEVSVNMSLEELIGVLSKIGDGNFMI